MEFSTWWLRSAQRPIETAVNEMTAHSVVHNRSEPVENETKEADANIKIATKSRSKNSSSTKVPPPIFQKD